MTSWFPQFLKSAYPKPPQGKVSCFFPEVHNSTKECYISAPLPCKSALTCSRVGLSVTKPSPPPSFLVRRVHDMDTQQDEKQNLSKGGGAPYEPMAIHISCPTVSVDILLQLGNLYMRRLVAGFALHLHSKNHSFHKTYKKHEKKKSENPLCRSTSCAAAVHRQLTG